MLQNGWSLKLSWRISEKHLTHELRRTPSRNSMKSLGRACNGALQSTEAVPFGPFWPRYTDQIHAWSAAHALFHTVSEGEFCDVRAATTTALPNGASLFALFFVHLQGHRRAVPK